MALGTCDDKVMESAIFLNWPYQQNIPKKMNLSSCVLPLRLIFYHLLGLSGIETVIALYKSITGPIGLVTVLGNRKSVTVSDCHFQYKKVLFGTEKCISSLIFTLTGVTVSDRVCCTNRWKKTFDQVWIRIRETRL